MRWKQKRISEIKKEIDFMYRMSARIRKECGELLKNDKSMENYREVERELKVALSYEKQASRLLNTLKYYEDGKKV
jgi:DNA-binding transcriptional regulator GbsR (MarR family)